MIYNKDDNYCTLSPDMFAGVKFNYGCYLHDRQYRNEVKVRKTRREADTALKNYILAIYTKNGKSVLGCFISRIYYIGTRVMGYFTWVKE